LLRPRRRRWAAQEADAAGDDDYVATINLALNQADAGDSGDEAAAMEADALPPAPAPPAAPAASSSSLAAISGADLAAVLGSILSGGSSGGAAAAAAAQRRALDAGPSLGDVLRPELVAPLLQQPGMAERLALYLPEEQRCGVCLCWVAGGGDASWLAVAKPCNFAGGWLAVVCMCMCAVRGWGLRDGVHRAFELRRG
jgi:hypothetical protein